MSRDREPLSRQERQKQTRDALITVARGVFAEDGYHAASLDRIAREAGFSKGAVYSNFHGKAELFLAVMDANLEMADADLASPFADEIHPSSTGQNIAEREGFPLEATQGFALATLEFVSSAARDEKLAPLLQKRLEAVLERYTRLANQFRTSEETLPAEEIGKLLAGLDQGIGLILLSGGATPDPAIFQSGMRRLLNPVSASTKDAQSYRLACARAEEPADR